MNLDDFNIESLSDEQLAGQRLMVGFEGQELNRDLEFLIGTLKVGGIILFAGNVSTPDQVKALCASAQEYAAACKQPPLLIAIDQEGGQVARLKEPFTQFSGNPAMRGEADAASFADVTAKELCQVGINMNMAPVMDVGFPDIDSVMAQRVFGNDPKWVSRLGLTIINGLQQKKIMAVAKHFPGIGRTTLDSHLYLPVLDTPLEEMEATDLVPFRAAIEAGVSGIMLSHILYRAIDPEWPASLSRRVAKELLRERMGYEGVVMTDDLDMKAIKHDIQTVIRQILAADIDISLICHKGPNIEAAFREILKRIRQNDRLKAAGMASVKRILNLKRRYLAMED